MKMGTVFALPLFPAVEDGAVDVLTLYDDNAIEVAQPVGADDAERKEVADAICRAVNNHDALVAAAETALEALDMIANGRTFNGVIEDTGATARLCEALAKAKGP